MTQPAAFGGFNAERARETLFLASPPKERRSFDDFPNVTFGLLILLFAVFSVEKHVAFDFTSHREPGLASLIAFGGAGYDLLFTSGQLWRAFLAPLLHTSASHLLGNAFVLGIAGWRLEPRIGSAWFAAVFAIGALGGLVGSLLGNPHAAVTVGASGAITGLLGALLVVSIRAGEQDRAAMRFTALRFGIPALAPLLFGMASHVDYHAHLGGAIAGAVTGLALNAIWPAHELYPGYTGVAAKGAAACLAGTLLAAVLAARGFPS